MNMVCDNVIKHITLFLDNTSGTKLAQTSKRYASLLKNEFFCVEVVHTNIDGDLCEYEQQFYISKQVALAFAKSLDKDDFTEVRIWGGTRFFVYWAGYNH